MHTERTRVLVEIALCVALAATISVYKITLPWNIAGGSVSLSMLPIFIIALRRGVLVGVVAGGLFGVLDYFIEPYFVHPVQIVLDYTVAFAACGLAGLGARRVHESVESGLLSQAGIIAVPYVLLGGLGRFVASFVSGVVFFAANAPEGQPVWLFSLGYNASYLVPSVLACAALAALIVPALEKAVPSLPITTPTRA